MYNPIPIVASKTKQKIKLDWYKEQFATTDFDKIEYSSKFVVLFSILAECEARGEKLLVFSQSLRTLAAIEHFLKSSTSIWEKEVDYFRLDGKTDTADRAAYYTEFNKPENTSARFIF